MLLALQGLWRFYVCALRTPPTCAVDAPGAGGGLLYQATCVLMLQCLVWAAFALLPYSHQYGELSLLGRRHAGHKQSEGGEARRAHPHPTFNPYSYPEQP